MCPLVSKEVQQRRYKGLAVSVVKLSCPRMYIQRLVSLIVVGAIVDGLIVNRSCNEKGCASKKVELQAPVAGIVEETPCRPEAVLAYGGLWVAAAALWILDHMPTLNCCYSWLKNCGSKDNFSRPRYRVCMEWLLSSYRCRLGFAAQKMHSR